MRRQIEIENGLGNVREGCVSQVAGCLLGAQALLSEAGLMAPSWKTVEPMWRTAIKRCGNMSDAMLLTAALQVCRSSAVDARCWSCKRNAVLAHFFSQSHHRVGIKGPKALEIESVTRQSHPLGQV